MTLFFLHEGLLGFQGEPPPGTIFHHFKAAPGFLRLLLIPGFIAAIFVLFFVFTGPGVHDCS
jgi:hypothetical protein